MSAAVAASGVIAVTVVAVAAMSAANADVQAEAGANRGEDGSPNHNRIRADDRSVANHDRGGLIDNGRLLIDDGGGLVDHAPLDDDRLLNHDRRGLLNHDGLLHDDRRGLVGRRGVGRGGGLGVDRSAAVVMNGLGQDGAGDDAGEHFACGGPFLVPGPGRLSSGRCDGDRCQ
jgi:hypothetical protein